MNTQETEDGTQTLEINGVELTVTPAMQLPFPRNITAGVIAARLRRRIENGELMEANRDVLNLCELCIDEQVSAATLETLDAHDLAAIIGTVFPDVETET